MNCVFRIAAGPRLGFGHLMRARALARALGTEVRLSVRGGRSARLAARAMGCDLTADRTPLAAADVLVVDDPSAEERRRWIERARRHGVWSVSVEDGALVPGADLVVSAAIDTPRLPTKTAILSGARFYLLDPRVAAARRARMTRSKGLPPRILIALGGGRHVGRIAQDLVDALVARCPDASIEVASGFSPARRGPLRRARWLSARTGLAAALLRADVAIVAGGVTLYEACAIGVPAVALSVVPAQRRAIRAFARLGAVIDAGGGSGGAHAVAAAARGAARLMGDARLRSMTAARAGQLVDGLGAERVARSVRALVAQGAPVRD